MTDPQQQPPPAAPAGDQAAAVTCSCGVARPARHSVEVTLGPQTVIVTSDAPDLATVAATARDLFDHSRPTPRDAAGFASGSAPASAMTERRGSYETRPAVPAVAGPGTFTPTAEQPYDLSWIKGNGAESCSQ